MSTIIASKIGGKIKNGYDYVVVGGGSAGCVVAARQSEDPAVQVALIEAGPIDDAPEVHTPVAFPQLFILGVLADGPTNTLWACEIIGAGKDRHSILRSFDLTSAAPKLRWPLPGDIN